jgi:hypothetical protein
VYDKASWDTADYEGKPILIGVKYDGVIKDHDNQYYNRRAAMTLWVNKPERDPDATPVGLKSDLDDDGDDEDLGGADGGPTDDGDDLDDDDDLTTVVGTPTLATQPAPSAGAVASAPTTVASTATASPADPGDLPATERQVKFMFAIAREAGIDDEALQDLAVTTYGCEVTDISRSKAVEFIRVLQGMRTEVAAD